MKARDFCYWLQGMFELAETKSLTERQTDLIRRHLALVFQHDIDPSIDGGDPDVKKKMDEIHRPPSGGGRSHGPIIRC